MNTSKLLIILLMLPAMLVAQKKSKEKQSPANTIAYIEQTKILAALQGFEQNKREIDSLTQVYTNEIQLKTQQLNKKLQELLKPYPEANNADIESIQALLNENELTKFELYLQENELIQQSSKNYDIALQTMYDQKLQPLLDKVNSTIETYAQANGIQVVYTLENISQALAYIDKGSNITNQIIALLE